jgi:hypothetical protein
MLSAAIDLSHHYGTAAFGALAYPHGETHIDRGGRNTLDSLKGGDRC